MKALLCLIFLLPTAALAQSVRTAPVHLGSSDCSGYYPINARANNIEGYATVGFTISVTGELSDIAVVKTSGQKELDDAAVECARHWRYSPALENGKAISVAWRSTIKFSTSRW